MAKRPKTGGRVRGTPNKIKSAHQDFLDAWEKDAGPATARKLLKAAIDKALGYDCSEKTYDEFGKLVKTKKWREYKFEPLAVILPYIARKLPQELTGADGEPLIPASVAPLMPPIDFSKWTPEQVDAYIAATSAAAKKA